MPAPLLGGLLLVAAAVSFSCVSSQPGRPQTPDGAPALFAAEVQPILMRRCGYLGCHGREGMPLVLYSVDYLRLRDPRGEIDPTRPPLDERALAPAEVDHNRQALAARAGVADPGGARLLRRLIPTAEGGIAHAGIAVYPSQSEPELEVLRRFLATVPAK